MCEYNMKLHLSSVYGEMVLKERRQFKMFKKVMEKFYKVRMVINLEMATFFLNLGRRLLKKADKINKVFYPKWVLGECHHSCRRCAYKNECFSNLESEKF